MESSVLQEAITQEKIKKKTDIFTKELFHHLDKQIKIKQEYQ